MFQLTEIESKYLDLIERRCSLAEFEQWVYGAQWLEETLGPEGYLDCISLNYNTPSARYELGKIMKIDEGRIQTSQMLRQMEAIIQMNEQAAQSLINAYDGYCRGYYFLEDLGLGIGLQLSAPVYYGYDKNSYEDLSAAQKEELLRKVLPAAVPLAQAVKDWLLSGDITLAGKKDEVLNRWEYTDHRSVADRASRVWTKETREGALRSRANRLLDALGRFVGWKT